VSSPTPGEGQASATPVTTPGTAANGTTTTGASAAAGIGTPAAGASPGEFDLDTGSYTSFVRLKADWMQTIATPVSVSRSEDTEIIPLLIGMGGGLSGFLLFTLLRRIHNDDLLVKEPWVLWLAGTVSVVVGAGTAFFTNYYNQDVWTVDANGLALFTAAVSASTAGVAAGLLTGIYNTSAAERAEDRRAADQAATTKRS
jgi:hypothetical protein